MAGSVQAAVRAAFVTELESALELDPVFVDKGRVQFAWSSKLEDVRERVWTRGANTSISPAVMRSGPTVSNESGEFYVFVEVIDFGPLEEVIDRCYDLAAVVIGQAAAHKNDLAVTGLKWITPGDVTHDAEGQVDRGAGCRLRCAINYEARLENA